MRDENSKKSKLSWSKTLAKKWFNIKSKSQDFHADNSVGRDMYCKKNPDLPWQTSFDCNEAQLTYTQNYRMFVATWNAGGKSPPSYLNLNWLHSSPPADIYVLGFQEIVPLNAGNVLGVEDNAPARKWISIISKTLNNLPSPSGYELDVDSSGSGLGSSTRQKNSSFFHRRSLQSLGHSSRIDGDTIDHNHAVNRRFSVCDRVSFGGRPSDSDPSFKWGGSSDDENIGVESPSTIFFSPISYGYGVPKGSISISISLHQTTFCFICCHLTSGQKEGDELRRNSDVLEIHYQPPWKSSEEFATVVIRFAQEDDPVQFP